MTVSISSSSSPQPAVATYSPSESSPAESAPKPAATPEDSVKLSQAAQVHLMKQQGQALSQIAANLGIPVSAVNGYLGVSVPKAAAASIAGSSPAPAKSTASEKA